jgi:L-lactate utilization protein LutC
MTKKQNILKDMLWNNWQKMISIEVAGELLTKNPTDDYWKQNRKQKVSELADSMQELVEFISSLDTEVEDTTNAELDAYMLSLPKYTQSKEGFIQDAKMFFEAENR